MFSETLFTKYGTKRGLINYIQKTCRLWKAKARTKSDAKIAKSSFIKT